MDEKTSNFIQIGKTILPVILLGSICAFVFWPVLKGQGTLQWDAKEVHLFNLMVSSKIWREGAMPLWNPFIFNGYPQFADPQAAIYYPPNLLIGLFKIFTPRLMMYQIIFHYLLAGIFTFFFVRYLTKNAAAGTFCAIAYMFCGFLTGHASHVGMMNTAAWLPLILWLTFLLFDRQRLYLSPLLGLTLAFAFLAGHFQTFLFVAFMWGLLLIALIIRDFKKFEKRTTWHLVAALAIFALTIAIQFIPTLELTKISARDAIPLETAQSESLPLDSFWGILNPNHNNAAFGGPYSGPWDRTQNYLYIGLSTLALALAGVIFSKNKIKYFFLFTALLSAEFALGRFFAVQPFFYKFVPFFDKIRAPSNMMLLAEFSLILLAGLGIEYLKNKLKKYFLPVAAALIFIIAAEIAPITRFNTLLYARQTPESVVEEPEMFKVVSDDYNELKNEAKFSTYRLYEIGLDKNFTQIFDIYSLDGYNPLSLTRQGEFEDVAVANGSIMDMAGVKYLPCQYLSHRAEQSRKIGKICVNDNIQNRIYLTPNYIGTTNKNEALEQLQRSDLKSYAILEARPDNFNSYTDNGLSLNGKITRADYSPNLWQIETYADNRGLLVIRETNYPGWEAYVNGKLSPIYQANYLYKAVALPAGANKVTLKFNPTSFKYGLWLTLMGLSISLIIFAFSIYDGIKKRRRTNANWQP